MSTVKRNSSAGFYWLGMALTLACFGLVLAGNTELLWRFEHIRLPLSWVCGGGAILAFLAAEFCHIPAREEEEESSQLSSEWEAVEY